MLIALEFAKRVYYWESAAARITQVPLGWLFPQIYSFFHRWDGYLGL
jgi:hypothetical protein